VLPVSGASAYRFVLGGLPTPAAPGDPMVMRLVSPGYFRAMGIRVLAGRSFSDSSSGREVLLSAELARRYFGNVSPIGRIVGQGLDTYEVVGIVADVRHEGFQAQVRPEYYLDLGESALIATTRPYFVVRSSRAPEDLVPTVRAAVRQLDPAAGVGANVAAMADLVSESVSRPRFNAAVLSAFAAIAVLLAAIAVHGVMAYAVAQRSREIAVRVALGARRTDVIRLVLREGAVMTAAGTTIGLGGALALTRSMQAMLFGVTPFDLATFVAVPLALALVATLASLGAVHRATKVDPATALRSEH
jgi:putative ABC transport system permease protein